MKTQEWMACVVAVLVMGFGCSRPSSEGNAAAKTDETAWMTDFEQAQQASAARKVPILADFSGSDWCGWCIKLDSEVFSTPEFKEFAKQNLVLFLADFPAKKEQTEELKNRNRALAEKYGVEGFPTVLLLDSQGQIVAKTGYQPGGAQKYIEHLTELLNKAKN